MENSENVLCDNCFEHLVFMLQDSQGHKFSIGLSTILQCLVSAVDLGNLPKLPISWLQAVDDVYRTTFSFDENVLYYNPETYEKRNKQK